MESAVLFVTARAGTAYRRLFHEAGKFVKISVRRAASVLVLDMSIGTG